MHRSCRNSNSPCSGRPATGTQGEG
jgi:hypothetical protein